ncbi:MAG TPA: sigma-54 dependent transcriptional regulator [Blastocatellia bacterium]|nr:sigma-54 dependent transcriptional regulator [Blastocatellia bacterium]
MTEPAGRILVVEDEPAMAEMLANFFGEQGHASVTRASGEEALSYLADNDVDLVLLDVHLPEMSGIELLERLRSERPGLPAIVMTAFGSVSTAVEAMKLGATDYIAKPFQMDELVIVVRKALELRKLEREVEHLRHVVHGRYDFSNIIGRSKRMQELFEIIKRIAQRRDASVLIMGSTGTGKELVARAIHFNSDRRGAPFIPINCSAIPETLMESELFGHQKGSFTGAHESRAGLIEEAQGGTIFLDEINSISLNMQVKLLRVIQERSVRRVGGRQATPVDVRFISATNEDLESMVAAGTFRQDLFYRLNVVPVRIPDLKDRREDIPLLVHHFLQSFAERAGETVRKFNPEAMRVLMTHNWPGNVRELENAVEYALTMGLSDVLGVTDLPDKVTNPERDVIEEAAVDGVPLAEVERRYILRVLKKMGGHQIRTAQMLGIDRRTLYRRLRQYGVESARGRDFDDDDFEEFDDTPEQTGSARAAGTE